MFTTCEKKLALAAISMQQPSTTTPHNTTRRTVTKQRYPIMYRASAQRNQALEDVGSDGVLKAWIDDDDDDGLNETRLCSKPLKQ
jgi:hypothetical protein